MKKILIVFVMLLAVCSTASAVVTQRILLKDGSVLNGFIQIQDGSGSMTVSTDSAVICVSREVFNITENANSVTIVGFVPVNKKDSAATSESKSKFWNFLNNKTFNNVRIVERGATVRFVETVPNTYEIAWDDVVSIRSDKRATNALSGIKRHYFLKSNREVEGEYAGETKNTISLFLESGIVETIKIDDVMKYTLSAINPDQEIFEQSPLLDVVRTPDLREFKGIIIEQNRSNDKDSENYISIWQHGRSPQVLKLSEVTSISKEQNDAYKPKFDIILKEGEVLVNRMPVDIVKTTESNDVLLLDCPYENLDSLFSKVTVSIVPSNKVVITVEYREPGKTNVETYQLVKLSRYKIKKSIYAYGFTYKNLANATRPTGNVETSINKTTKAQYTIDATGNYCLYDSKKKVAIPVTVK